MDRPKVSATQICFIGQIIVGLGVMFYRLFIVGMQPYMALDVVLDKTELADNNKRQSTLEMLQKATGHSWICPSVAGAAILTISAIGLVISRNKQASQALLHETVNHADAGNVLKKPPI